MWGGSSQFDRARAIPLSNDVEFSLSSLSNLKILKPSKYKAFLIQFPIKIF